MKRRTFLCNTVAASAAVGAGLLSTSQVLADNQATEAVATDPFKAKTLEEALVALKIKPETSDAIHIKAPEIAENGAVVPITVSSDIAEITGISILVTNNPSPMAATFHLTERSVAKVSTRIKMGKTSDVIAIVQAGDKSYMAKQEIKVTIGGCGG